MGVDPAVVRNDHRENGCERANKKKGKEGEEKEEEKREKYQ
jgi:hypothetical protein